MRIGNKSKAIFMTRSDTWTTPVYNLKLGMEEEFCVNHCPHKDEVCNGDCKECKEFRKKNSKRK